MPCSRPTSPPALCLKYPTDELEDGLRATDESSERPRLSTKEAALLGKAIYEQDIRHQVEADHHGEVVAIDVDSGNWAVAEDLRMAVDRLREAQPEAINILCERAGYLALRGFGLGSRIVCADGDSSRQG